MSRFLFRSVVLHAALMVSALSEQSSSPNSPDQEFAWTLRTRPQEASSFQDRRWKAARTAFIVCDMWDYHHSVNAVRRLREFAPRLDAVLAEARDRGATIIHSPSDCMAFYADHPARVRALAIAKTSSAPEGVADWCHRIPEEEKATYPIDQSNGGEDDDLQEHAQWAAYLKSIGRNPGTPWKRQTDLLSIDAESDFVCAEGDVVWNVLDSRGIDHVVLVGVHTNMCVLGRPFGLRQMKRGGKDVILMRDMTDVMYEPNSWPYVSHFTGIDLVIEHIERFVCPTVTSDQVLGGKPFRFRNDRRPTVAILSGSQAAGVREMKERLEEDFRVQLVSGVGPDLDQADVLLLTKGSKTALIPSFEATGRPLVGPIVDGLESAPSSPTKVLPASPEAHLLRHVEGAAASAWIGVRPDGGRRFWGSSNRTLVNGCYWATDRAIPNSEPRRWERERTAVGWQSKRVPESIGEKGEGAPGEVWWRCLALVPPTWKGHLPLQLEAACFGEDAELHVNGEMIRDGMVSGDLVQLNALNHIAIRARGRAVAENAGAPSIRNANGEVISLEGRWQRRRGNDPDWANFPIPPQFGASTDFIFEAAGEP